MSDIYENDVMVEEDGFDEIETGGDRNLSTALGVGLIAGAGVIVYEGGKRGFKLLKTKVVDPLREKRAAKKAQSEAPADGQPPQPPLDGEAK